MRNEATLECRKGQTRRSGLVFTAAGRRSFALFSFYGRLELVYCKPQHFQTNSRNSKGKTAEFRCANLDQQL